MHHFRGRVVLSLCDRTANMVWPWVEAGYTAICVDLQHEPGWHLKSPGLWLVGEDIYDFLPPRANYAFACGFPPCTDLAVSGARWFKDKGLPSLVQGLGLVSRCKQLLEWCGCAWFLENPVSTISTYWRKPDYAFDPCDYGGYLAPAGDKYTKKTCLWTGGGFVMPEPRRVEPVEGSKMHLMSPGDQRANLRSETPMGFARAVFEANSRHRP